MSTCVRQDRDTPRAGLPRLLCRRAEQWAGGARRVSGQGEVVCSDPSFVHCRAVAAAGQPVNTCQSVKHKCNGHCFKGTFEFIARMYLTHRRFRGIESRVLKVCDFKKVIFSPIFKHNITGFGVLIPKRYHMLG